MELAAACPPELKLAEEAKASSSGRLEWLLLAEVIDRPKGYFPVPALSHLDGPYLELAAEALRSPAARERGLFEPAYVDELLAAPNEQRTTLDGSKLWQLALLELWLSEQGL